MDSKISTEHADGAQAPRAPHPNGSGGSGGSAAEEVQSASAPSAGRAPNKGLLAKLRDRLQKRIRGRSKQGANIYPLY